MNHYIITYLGGDQPSSPEAGKQHYAKYQVWLKELGDAIIKAMVPYKNNHTINANRTVTEGSSIAMSGHTIIQAASIQDAIEIAKTCPFLDINGSLEVAEIIQMPN